MPVIENVPVKPEHEYEDVLYSNLTHVINRDVVDFLIHNQDHCAVHAAKGYCGYVFCCTDPATGKIVWYEEIWIFWEPQTTYYSEDLTKLLNVVTDNLGYA